MALCSGMIRVCMSVFLVNLSVLLFPLYAADDRVVEIRPVSGKIHVDGLLDEPAWQQSPSISGLTQVEPHPGEPATEATRIWLAYTKDSLYIAVRCEDHNPKEIVATEMRRDAFLMDMNNDNIEFILDTYHDHRNAYFFS